MTVAIAQERRMLTPVALTSAEFKALSAALYQGALESEPMANLLSEHARTNNMNTDCMGAQFEMLGVLLLGGKDGEGAFKLSNSGSLRAQLMTDGESFALIYQENLSKDSTRATVPIRVEVIMEAKLPFLQVDRPSSSEVFLLRAATLNWIVNQHASLPPSDKKRAQGLTRAMATGGGATMQEETTRLLDGKEPAEAILARYFTPMEASPPMVSGGTDIGAILKAIRQQPDGVEQNPSDAGVAAAPRKKTSPN